MANAMTVGLKVCRTCPNGSSRRASDQYCLLLIALCVRHAALINLPQKHLRKALIDLSQCVIKGCRLFRSNCRRDRRCELFDCNFTNGCLAGHRLFHPEGTYSAQPLGTTIGMFVHIAVIYVRCNISKQLAADLIGFTVKNDNVYCHFVFKKETADGVNCNLESLILWIAKNAGGDQGNATDSQPYSLASMSEV